MRDDVPGWNLKLDRAEQLLNELNAQVEEFLESDPYSVGGRFEPEDSDHFVVRVRSSRQVPRSWSPLIGDVLHNLRSALDHLAWHFACAHSTVPPPHTEFPLFIDRERFWERDKRGRPRRGGGLWKLEGVDPAIAERIEAMQPYNQESPDLDRLWWLHELNREDKHRTLHVAALARGVTGIQLLVDGRFRGGQIGFHSDAATPGAELFAKRIEGGPHVDVQIDGRVHPDIAFADGRIVVRVLKDIGDEIVQRVLPELEPLA